MKNNAFQYEIGGGVVLEIAIYGADADYFCRLSRTEPQTINDAFVPAAEIGALWVRKCEHRWLISGLVKVVNFPCKQDVHDVVYRILEWLQVHEMAHIRVDRVEYQEAETLHASMEEVDL